MSHHMQRPDIPDVDLFLRTSGEQRSSNFMLWQAAYAEYVFQDKLWPDYDRRDLWAACEEYASRNRQVRERIVPSLQKRLASILGEVLPVEEEPDGAVTVRHDSTIASLRVVTIAEGLDLVSLTQILAWDLPLTKKVSDQVAKQARDSNFGERERWSRRSLRRPCEAIRGKGASKTADVMLRYNFPGGGLTDDALRTLILLVLDTGAGIRRTLTSLPAIVKPALRAGAEDLDGVADVGETVLGGHFRRPLLDLVVAHLDGGAAAAADQMVVMVIGTPAVDRFTSIGAQRVDHPGRGHRLQSPVNGCQADVLAAAAQLIMQLLGRAELVERLQQRGDRSPLPGGADVGSGHWRGSSLACATASTTMCAR